MSSKPKKNRTKQYLMLLTVAGLIAIVGGSSSGTFASFNAEVSNTGNYFATGTLVLNDKSGTTTCTSAAATTAPLNHNNVSTNGCATLFSLGPITKVTATLGTALAANVTPETFSLALSDITGGSIVPGDSLVLDDTTTPDHTQTVVAASGPDSTGSISIASSAVDYTFPIGTTVTDITSNTQYAELTLTNAGTLDASGISFSVPGSGACTTSYNEGHGTLGVTFASLSKSVGDSITSVPLSGFSGDFKSGDPVVVAEGGHAQTFIANGNATTGASSVSVASQPLNYAYLAAATVSGPEFGTSDLCSQMGLSIVETDSNFNHDSTNKAAGCAYPVANVDNSVGLGCDITSGTTLDTDLSGSTDLTLKSGGGDSNSGTQLSAGKSRYFLVAVNMPLASFDNSFQNRKATFDLLWHIDQA